MNALLLSAICASIRPSVTLVINAQTVHYIEMSFAPYDRAMLDARFLSSSYSTMLGEGVHSIVASNADLFSRQLSYVTLV